MKVLVIPKKECALIVFMGRMKMIDLSWAEAFVISVGIICTTIFMIVLIGGGSMVSGGPEKKEEDEK